MQGPACGQRAAADAGSSRPFPPLPARPNPSLPTCGALPQPAQRRLTCGFSLVGSMSRAGTAQRLRGSTAGLGSTAALRGASAKRGSGAASLWRGRLRDLTPRACGIIGIYKASGDCNVEVYEGLLSLQVGLQETCPTHWPQSHAGLAAAAATRPLPSRAAWGGAQMASRHQI